MVDDIVSGRLSINDAINDAENRLRQLLQ
jgi:hypothetical protein